MNVLLSAYACCPWKGSEPQIGWNWAREVSAVHPTWIVTRRLHQRAIEGYLAQNPMPKAHFIYVDIPRWARAWKDLPGGVYLYYVLWQLLAYWRAKRLCAEVNFDLAQHVTFCAFWMPSFLPFLKAPFIWGPVGGGEAMPAAFRDELPLRQRIFERIRDGMREFALLNPLVRAAARRSKLALAGTPETAAYLDRLGCRNVQTVPVVGVNRDDLRNLPSTFTQRDGKFRVMSAGRLLAWKGFHLVLLAMAELRGQLDGFEYWIFGDGPDRRRLEDLVEALNLQDYVRFVAKVTRADLLARMQGFHVLAHPSLHDSGGFVCLEAMAAGCPVICLAMGGPAVQVDETSGFAVRSGSPQEAVSGIAEALLQLRGQPELYARLSAGARTRVCKELSFTHYMNQLSAYYGNAAGAEETADRPVGAGVRA